MCKYIYKVRNINHSTLHDYLLFFWFIPATALHQQYLGKCLYLSLNWTYLTWSPNYFVELDFWRALPATTKHWCNCRSRVVVTFIAVGPSTSSPIFVVLLTKRRPRPALPESPGLLSFPVVHLLGWCRF